MVRNTRGKTGRYGMIPWSTPGATALGAVIIKEEVSTTFDFIPGHAEVAGVLIFSHDPEAAEAQVSSYQQP